MSRRRGEFEHRTSIFEGAFRAWSHLGGLEPLDLETKPASDLDPLNFPLDNDPRLSAAKEKKKKNNDNPEGGGGGGGAGPGGMVGEDGQDPKANRREYPYEPLPRSGLAHPFVQAILSPWLGPDADQDAIQLGLTTLRTWWQHRRKGESGSAIVALGTDKMRGVVEGYTRHFFNLAHCLIVNDKEQPPRTLHGKMRDLEKTRNKKGKKRSREDESIKAAAMAFQSGFGPGVQMQQQLNPGDPNNMMNQMVGMGGGMMQNPNDAMMSPLDRLHAAQRRQLAESGGVHTNSMGAGGQIPDPAAANTQPIELKGRCMPGKVDLPGLVQQVSSAATQLAHRGIASTNSYHVSKMQQMNNVDPSKYGDPNITPVVLVSPNPNNNGVKDAQFYMNIEGITCAHCVKIVETVLKGCHGSRSPIDGLLDAAADMELNMVLIKIENIGDCRRIAHEAARNLSMVGYTAKARSLTIPSDITLSNVYSVMEGTIPALSPMMGFGWGYDCTCPDNNVLRQDCPRHSQMGPGVIEVFDKIERLTNDFIAGCSKKTGLPCTAGVQCFCQSDSGVANSNPADQQASAKPQSADSMYQNNNGPSQQASGAYMSYQQPIQDSAPSGPEEGNGGMPMRGGRNRSSMRMSIGRMSIGGLGGLGRHMSLTSETTFGRAMSGLSALSIDWENMDDFDINVDHSAGINNDIINGQQQQQVQNGQSSANPAADGQQGSQDNGTSQYGQQPPPSNNMGGGPRVARRSSLRKNIPPNPNNMNQAYNVSFNM